MAEQRAAPEACTSAANAADGRGFTLGGRLHHWQEWLREPCLTVLHLLPSLLIVAAVVAVSLYRVAVVIMVGEPRWGGSCI
jgi:hypothetical protein